MTQIKIIYEDKNLLAINKPAGLVVHSDGKTNEPTVVDWLIKNYPKIKGVGDEPELRPGIVHRLDKDTSGVLLIAKTQETFEELKRQFQEKEIKKEYLALVDGHLKKDWGIIDLPIGKSKKDFRKKTTLKNSLSKSREAVTEYRVLEKFAKNDLVMVLPKTGRTHQIRVHLAAIGHPVLGDKLYGFKNTILPASLTRHFLHARAVEFKLLNGENIKIEADLPEDLEEVLSQLRR